MLEDVCLPSSAWRTTCYFSFRWVSCTGRVNSNVQNIHIMPAISFGFCLFSRLLFVHSQWATAHGSPFRTWLAGEDFLQLAAEENFILGYDYSELKCGKKIIRAGTEYLWFEPPFAINPHEDFELEKKEKYILVTHTNWDADFGCVYKAGEVGGGPQSDPSREEDFALAASGETTSAAASLEPEEEEEDKEEKEDDDAPDDDVDVSGGVFGGSDSSSSTKSGGSCFPEGATVELEDGSSKSMRHLVAGDRVKIGADSFSDVFMFTHKLPDLVSPFVRLETASGKSISLSPGHYLYAGGSLVAADAVQMGDELTLADGSQSRVVSIVEEHKRGLYNPQTLHGDIVVDGVVTSTYTTAVQPSFAHSVLLGPARALYRAQLGRWLNGLLDAGASRLVRWLPSGSSVAA